MSFSTTRFARLLCRSLRSALTVLLLGGTCLTTAVQAQNYNWAKRPGDNGYGISVAIDASLNVYVAGYYSGSGDFDPGPGVTTLTSAGDFDIFVVKLNPAGDLIWARSMGSDGDDRCNGVGVDAAGNVYTAGSFQGTADFDPGAGVVNITAVGGGDIFVSKLDASGNYVWVKTIGSTAEDSALSLAVDASGNAHTTGYVGGTADFDPGSGTAPLTSQGSFDIFVSKLDASGNYIWAKQIGTSVPEVGYAIALDGLGNVYTTGYFSKIATDFDPGSGTANLTAIGNADAFVSKLDASGGYVWARQMGGSGIIAAGNSIAVDGSGNVCTTGNFSGSADFDPGSGTATLSSVGGRDIYISKLNASGGYVWAKSIGSTTDDSGYGIAVDRLGSVYTVGFFQLTADFDPGSGTANLTASNNSGFVSKLDASGSYAWAVQVGNVAQSVKADGVGGVYSTGNFTGTRDFNPGPNTANLTAVGGNSVFVSKLGLTELPVTLRYFNGRMTEAGALLGWETARETNNANFRIERSRDALAFESIGTVPSQAPDGNSLTPLTYTFTDPQPLPGTTYYRLVQTDRDGTRTPSHLIALSREGQPTVLYPNPVAASGEAVLEPALAYETYQITDVLGRLVQRAEQPGVLSRVSLAGLPAGVYALHVQTRSGVTVLRVMR